MTIAFPVWTNSAAFFGTGIATVDHGSRGVVPGRLILINGADVPVPVFGKGEKQTFMSTV